MIVNILQSKVFHNLLFLLPLLPLLFLLDPRLLGHVVFQVDFNHAYGCLLCLAVVAQSHDQPALLFVHVHLDFFEQDDCVFADEGQVLGEFCPDGASFVPQDCEDAVSVYPHIVCFSALANGYNLRVSMSTSAIREMFSI